MARVVIAWTGAITDQAADVRFERARGELVVTINGKTLVRVWIPPDRRAELAESLTLSRNNASFT